MLCRSPSTARIARLVLVVVIVKVLVSNLTRLRLRDAYKLLPWHKLARSRLAAANLLMRDGCLTFQFVRLSLPNGGFAEAAGVRMNDSNS